MRVFYIFNIKEEFVSLYKNNQSNLFNMLKHLYYLNNLDLDYGYQVLNQLIYPIEKTHLDNYLFLRLHQDIPYSKREGKHIINNLYRDEVSILEVKHAYIKITAEQNLSSFFDILYQYNHYFFICDFEVCDYFFLDELKTSCLIN